ncbi:MAG: hypothetical protein HY996_11615 [Micrococcales bacterium]|nr:hypothetical protein [Micrococcales bacterium]
MRSARILLVVLGLGLLAVGGVVLLQDVNPKRYLGILTWFVGALIIHDVVIAPLVFLVTLVGRRLQHRIPAAVLAIVYGALAVGGIVTLLVVPEILKKRIGVASSSILPLDYGANLAVFWAAIIVLTALAVLLYRAMARSVQKTRSPSTQS